MRSVLFVCVCLCALAGCETVTDEPSSVKTETGTVKCLSYMPPNHSNTISPTYKFGENGGFGVVQTVVKFPEQFGVAFECEHGGFAISGQKAKAVFHKLKQGMQVEIRYREWWRVVRDEGKVKSRTFVDLEFVDANPAE